MRALAIAAAGLALVVGVVVGGMVGNLFGTSAERTSAAAVTGSGCYTNWNDSTCAAGYTPVSTGEWTGVSSYWGTGYGVQAGGIVCAAAKAASEELTQTFTSTAAHQSQHVVSHEPCATCCATGPSVVGGFADMPAVAGPSSTSGMGAATYAVLAGAAAGVLAFAVLATLSVRRLRIR